MKKLTIVIAMACLNIASYAQNLQDIYKSGTVTLVADPDYASGNDWNKVFETYYDTIYNRPMGNRKSLKLMPDGSVVVNHQYRDYYSRFAPDGRFVKEFSLDSKPGVQSKHVYNIAGVLNGNTFFSYLDNQGNMLCFDFDGKYKKKLKLDYMTKQMIPLSNGKIAVVGWVLWTKKIREFVSIVDYETNEQNDIWQTFSDRAYFPSTERKMFSYHYKFPSGGMMGFSSMPFIDCSSKSCQPRIAHIGDKLLIAVPSTGEILVFDESGKQVARDQIEWTKNYLSVDEQKEIQRKAIEKFKNQDMKKDPDFDPNSEKMVQRADNLEGAKKAIIPQMEEDILKISEPIQKPMFSTILQDSDGNVLFFEFPEEEGQNKFNVWIYNNGGAFVGQSSFQCEDYELQINPEKLVFYDGFLYGLQVKKEVSGVPLRLVRFRLE